MAVTSSSVQILVERSLKAYKNLSRPSDHNKLSAICQEPFKARTGDSQNSKENCVVTVPVTPEVPSSTLPPTSSATTPHLRSSNTTPRKALMRKRLKFLSESRSDLLKKHKERILEIKELKSAKKSNWSKHRLEVKKWKQKTQRRDMKISSWEEKKKESLVLENARRQLAAERARCRRLLKKHESVCRELEEEIKRLNEVNKKKDAAIAYLENQLLEKEDVIEEESTKERRIDVKNRILIYETVVQQVATKKVPELLESFNTLDVRVPHKSTVELMVRELGIICDIQAAELLINSLNTTIGFDATTQEHVHVNSIHITTTEHCLVIALDQLPGGTAEDYEAHIHEAVDHLATVYSEYHGISYASTRKQLIANITNTMTDRAAVNHKTVTLLEAHWKKTLNELNCHLHPLETISRESCSALKRCESRALVSKLFGSTCVAAKIVLAVNKLRYKHAKGDPKGFVDFLKRSGKKRGLIPRYRGNRLHILFHTAGKLFVHHAMFIPFFDPEINDCCTQLRMALHADFTTSAAQAELQVLGLMGKLLTGPWMEKFYVAADSKLTHTDGIRIVKAVVQQVEEFAKNPGQTLSTTKDFFGQQMDDDIVSLQQKPTDEVLFCEMMTAALKGTQAALKRQYARYFEMTIDDQLESETKSARCHNIDAESVMGMFSASQARAPNATMCYISSTIRSRKNNVISYLDRLDEDQRNALVKYSCTKARKHRYKQKQRAAEVEAEISRRIAEKKQKKAQRDRKKVEKSIREGTLRSEFPDLSDEAHLAVDLIMKGTIVGHNVRHIWYDDDTREKVLYHGKVEKLKRKRGGTYVVAYWSAGESYSEAEDYEMTKEEMAADYVCGDLCLDI